MSFGPYFWAWTSLGLVAAIAYGAHFMARPETLIRAIVKTVFMGALAAGLIAAGTPAPLVAAAVASAIGDFLLAFDRKWVLPFGILSFLVAQLLYVIIFLALWFFSGDNSPLLPRYLAMAAIVLAAISFLVWMAPKLGWMALAVVPYAIAITGMGAAAMWLPWVGWPAMVGALLFLVSDFVLAAELFRLAPDSPTRRITAPIVWWTYAAAQIAIAAGVLLVAMDGAT